jgi:predicted transcriptional regulator
MKTPTTNIGFRCDDDLKAALQALADKSAMKLSTYVKRILERAAADDIVVREQTIYTSDKPTPRLTDEGAA